PFLVQRRSIFEMKRYCGSFGTELLTASRKPGRSGRGLAVLNRELVCEGGNRRFTVVVLDMDRTEIPVYGRQKPGAYDGHFEPTRYHPLLLFNGQGDWWR